MIYMADDREVSYPRRLYHDVTGTSLPEWETAGGMAVGGEEVGMPVGGAVTAAGQRLAAEWEIAGGMAAPGGRAGSCLAAKRVRRQSEYDDSCQANTYCQYYNDFPWTKVILTGY